jgi:hypothetical protein
MPNKSVQFSAMEFFNRLPSRRGTQPTPTNQPDLSITTRPSDHNCAADKMSKKIGLPLKEADSLNLWRLPVLVEKVPHTGTDQVLP